jgi:hypothetical protein
MSGCLPSGQVCRGRKLFAFERASAFGDPIVAAKLLISLGHFDHSRGPQVARARAILLVSCKISAFPFPKFLDAGGDSPGDIFGGLFLLRRSKNSPSRRHRGGMKDSGSKCRSGNPCGARVLAISTNNQSGGGGGCFGFGANARPVSRCGRFTLDVASCRAYSWSPTSLYCGLVSEARNVTTSSISDSDSANGCMSLSSQGP